MRTAADIARRALARAGVVAAGETATAAEIRDAVTVLADMIDSWSAERLTVFAPAVVVVPLAGMSSYRIGPSGDVVAVRPASVMSAFVRSGGVDSEVRLASPAMMDAISYKADPGTGYWMSWQGDMPDAVVRLWPAQAEGELHLRVQTPVAQILDPNDELVLPPGWFHALALNLAVHLCEEYGYAVTPVMLDTAQSAKANIKRANLQPAHATFDPALL